MIERSAQTEFPPDERPKLIGARVARLEDPRFLTGHGSYVADMKRPGLVHLAIRRSEQPHARVIGIETAAAKRIPGVIDVFTATTLPGPVKPIFAISRMRNYHATATLPLARDKVRYVGEPVAAVVAENRYIAEDAAESIEVAYEPLAVAVDAATAIEPNAPLLHEEAETNILAAREFSRGDPETVMAEAAIRVRGRFRFHRKTPAAIENRACLAEYDPGRGVLTLHSTTQVPGIIRDALVEILDLPGHRVRVVAPDVGGGFGGKCSLYPEEILAAALARRLGRPVKWVGDRLEDLASTGQAFDEAVDAEMGLDAAGRILALIATAIGDIGAYSIYPWTAAIEPVQVVSFLTGPYRVPNYRGAVQAVATPKAPSGPYRGVGRPVATFVAERLMDMAAKKLGLDPGEIRLRNFIADDEFPYKAPSGLVWDQAGFTECLIEARKAIGYDALRAEQTKARDKGRRLGIGFASYAELTGLGSRISAAPGMPINTGTESAKVRIDSTGAVTATFGIASHGQGLETTLAQVVAETLGVGVADVRVIHGDSAEVAHGTGTYASRSAVLGGGAALLAARAVREKAMRIAAHLLEAAPDDLDAAAGQIFVKGTDRRLSFRDLARAVYSEIGRIPKELQEHLEASKVYDPYFGTTTSATHIAVVEVDPETCKVTPLRYVAVEDCGRVINPLIVDGQVHGGVAQGIGAALTEEVVYDDKGQLLSASFVDYVMPGACEIPPIEAHHIAAESPSTVGGFRGMGEGGTIGAVAAIANAISDALAPEDIDVNELPATPQRLFRLLHRAED